MCVCVGLWSHLAKCSPCGCLLYTLSNFVWRFVCRAKPSHVSSALSITDSSMGAYMNAAMMSISDMPFSCGSRTLIIGENTSMSSSINNSRAHSRVLTSSLCYSATQINANTKSPAQYVRRLHKSEHVSASVRLENIFQFAAWQNCRLPFHSGSQHAHQEHNIEVPRTPPRD